MGRRQDEFAEQLRTAAAIEEPAELGESAASDLSSATPLQVLENIAVNGKSETARVQALKVLLDRQHQLQTERQQRHGQPEKCPECLEREKLWEPSDELAAETLEILFDLGVLLPRLLEDATANADRSDRLGAWLREEVLADARSVEAEIERRAQERVQELLPDRGS